MKTLQVTIQKTLKTKKDAVLITGTLSNPSKMPCKGYSTPAIHCNTGSKLRNIKGSVCYDCYAMGGCYTFSNVQKTLQNRYDSINNPQWQDAMIVNIKGSDFFRWHDSGDIVDDTHLIKIFEVCHGTPETMHWLPTKEKAIVRRVLKAHTMPENLIIRYSMPMVDDTPRAIHNECNTSTSVSCADNKTDKLCIAYRTKKDGSQITETEYKNLKRNEKGAYGYCGNCRACWSKDIKNVSYIMH